MFTACRKEVPAMSKLVASNDLELEFTKLCEEHSAKINDLYEQAKKLSDETGVPFANYVPDSFENRFGHGGVDVELVRQLTGAKGEFWYSSSANC
jgi:hypothetical protein